jgi:long-chain acyl-CoA synthetase
MVENLEKTISIYMHKLVEVYGDKPCLVYRKEFRCERWSYKDIYDYGQKIAGFFNKKGLKKGDKIIIYSYNCPEWGSILLACGLSGIIAIPIDFNSGIEFVKTIKKKTNAKLIFSSKYKSVFEDDIFIEELDFQTSKFKNYVCKTKIEEEDILEIVYTSGTTSDPKGVIITNENIVSNIRSIREIMPLTPKYSFLSIIPLSHLLEQTLGFFIPLRFGCKIVYINSRKSSTIIEGMKEEKITTMVGVPILLKTLKDKIIREIEKQGMKKKFDKYFKKSDKWNFFFRRLIFSKIRKKLNPYLKFFVVGGAPLDPETEKFWNNLGILVLQGYGLTETSPVLTCNAFGAHKEKTVGKVLPNQEIRLVDGEIICKGDNVTQGYYQNKKITNETIKDKWFYTGDLGEFDKNGFLTIKGRKKNMILTSSGLNVYPEDIEGKIKGMPEVKDCVVLGIKKKNDIVITAVVLTKEKIKSNFSETINLKLESHQKIGELVIWPEKDFPRTPSMKIKRKEVEEYLNNKKIVSNNEKSSNKLFQLLAGLSSKNVSKISINSNLTSDLAIDSLHRVEMLSLIEEEYGVEIEESKITEKTKVKDVLDLIENSTSQTNKLKLNFINVSNWIQPIRFFVRLIVLTILRFVYPIKVIGKNNLKKINGSVIYVMNHTSHFDSPTLIRAIPFKKRSKIIFAAAEDYFFKKGFFNTFKRMFIQIFLNIFPFSRGGNIKNSLKISGKLLDEGFSIGIFPEGTRSTTGKMSEFKSGIGLIASHMDVPSVPVKFEGLFEILPKGKIFPRLGRAVVKVGEPILFENEESYIEITNKIHKSLVEL